MVPLSQLSPIIMGPWRDQLIAFEGSDWCCRQAAIYLNHILRHFGHDPMVLEGQVGITAQGQYGRILLTHAWIYLPAVATIVDPTITQANWVVSDTKPRPSISPIWGKDPPHLSREVQKIYSAQEIADFMPREHWNKPGQRYRDICQDMLSYVINRVVIPSYVALP